MERRTHAGLHARIQDALRDLPSVGRADVEAQDICAICLTPFDSIFEEELAGLDKRQENQAGRQPPHGDENEEDAPLGVTRVAHCGHLFCRKDLMEWIRGFHGNCPTCRHPFLDIKPPSESDDESSDGGEYIPNPADYDDDNETIAFTDTFSDELDPEDRAEIRAIYEEHRALEEEREALEQEFAAEILEGNDRAEAEALYEELGAEADARDEQEALEQEFASEVLYADERAEAEALYELCAQEDAREEQEALEQEFGSCQEEDDMDVQEEHDALEQEYAAEALMDVYLTDNSSDLDYEPQDYMMSDTESEVLSSDFDYSVGELECLDQHGDPIAVYYNSSNDILLGLVSNDEKAPSVETENAGPQEI